MTPVLQTAFYDGDVRGNCWQAVIASLLDLPLVDVPHFVQIDADGGEDFLEHTVRFLTERGWRLRLVPLTQTPTDEPYIQTGMSPRSPASDGTVIHHAVVYRNGELLHDPHPDGTGLRSVGGAYRVVAVA